MFSRLQLQEKQFGVVRAKLLVELGEQPSWSDFPIVLLTHQGGGPERNPDAVRLGQVRDAFFRLAEEQRAALHLVAIEGMAYRDAADALGIPVGTLMSRIGRARAALRALEEDGPRARLSIVGGRDDRSA